MAANKVEICASQPDVSDSMEMPGLLVSIIIPAYNEEQFLPGCLESISSMDFPKHLYEVIVVDNGSTDSTREIAASFNCLVLCDPLSRVSGLRNLGARHAQGQILAFVDADCLVTRDWLKTALRYYGKTGMSAWGAPPTVPQDATWVQQCWNLVRSKQEPVQEVDWLESMNLFIPRNIFGDVGGFNAALETCEDVDICLRLRRFGMILADTSIRVIHLGEARTLNEFFRKELWRGKSNLRGVFSHGFHWQELPSLTLPFYFGIFWPVALLLLTVLWSYLGAVIAIMMFLCPSILALAKQRKKGISLSDIPRMLLIFQIYFLARTYSSLRLL
jgi:glycosyltransferase involved in cell wall biosynthesis